jgi:hypothetical protein
MTVVYFVVSCLMRGAQKYGVCGHARITNIGHPHTKKVCLLMVDLFESSNSDTEATLIELRSNN